MIFSYTYEPLGLSVTAKTQGEEILLTYTAPRAGSFSLLYPMTHDVKSLIASLDGFYRYGSEGSDDPEMTTLREPPLNDQAMVINVLGEILSHGPEKLRLRPGVSF